MRVFSLLKKSIGIIKKKGIKIFFREIQFYLARKSNKKNEPHFIQEYQNYLNNLLKVFPRDEALSIAAGMNYSAIGTDSGTPGIDCGSYIETGILQKEILLHYGLKPNMSIIDFGCGSGRLAHALPADYNLDYLGIDVIEDLLKFARTKSPKNYKFNIHKKLLSVPVKSESIDFICAFELFPLLLHEEIYIYLEDMKRALKKGGRVIFSFLEFDNNQHWHVFCNSVHEKINKMPSHLNTYTEKSVLKLWAEKIGYKIIGFTDGTDKKFNGKNFGQSLAVFEKLS